MSASAQPAVSAATEQIIQAFDRWRPPAYLSLEQNCAQLRDALFDVVQHVDVSQPEVCYRLIEALGRHHHPWVQASISIMRGLLGLGTTATAILCKLFLYCDMHRSPPSLFVLLQRTIQVQRTPSSPGEFLLLTFSTVNSTAPPADGWHAYIHNLNRLVNWTLEHDSPVSFDGVTRELVRCPHPSVLERWSKFWTQFKATRENAASPGFGMPHWYEPLPFLCEEYLRGCRPNALYLLTRLLSEIRMDLPGLPTSPWVAKPTADEIRREGWTTAQLHELDYAQQDAYDDLVWTLYSLTYQSHAPYSLTSNATFARFTELYKLILGVVKQSDRWIDRASRQLREPNTPSVKKMLPDLPGHVVFVHANKTLDEEVRAIVSWRDHVLHPSVHPHALVEPIVQSSLLDALPRDVPENIRSIMAQYVTEGFMDTSEDRQAMDEQVVLRDHVSEYASQLRRWQQQQARVLQPLVQTHQQQLAALQQLHEQQLAAAREQVQRIQVMLRQQQQQQRRR